VIGGAVATHDRSNGEHANAEILRAPEAASGMTPRLWMERIYYSDGLKEQWEGTPERDAGNFRTTKRELLEERYGLSPRVIGLLSLLNLSERNNLVRFRHQYWTRMHRFIQSMSAKLVLFGIVPDWTRQKNCCSCIECRAGCRS
jgi:hypothetical protein